MANADAAASIVVVVAWSPARAQVEQTELTLPAGSTLWQAVQLSAWQRQHPGVEAATQKLGVWGTLCAPEHVLRDGDRVEIYRPLSVDPKESRRQRQQAAGARRNGNKSSTKRTQRSASR